MRRTLVILMFLTLLAGCGRVRTAVPVVAILLSDDVRMPKVEGLRAGLSDLGYPPDSLQFTVYSAKGDRTALPDLAAQVLSSRPAVAVAGGSIEAQALKGNGDSGIPVVMMGVASTIRSGLVESLVRPGGNLTGLDNQHAELSAKRLELLTKLLPAVRRVLLLYDPLIVPGRHAREVTEETAARMGIATRALPAETVEASLSMLRSLRPGEFDAALLLPGFVFESGARQITLEFDRLRLPVMGPLELEGRAGLLAAYGISMRNQGYQSARFVVKLLQGGNPANIPVETPDNPELVVDPRVARRLGLKLSPVGMAFARTAETGAGEGE